MSEPMRVPVSAQRKENSLTPPPLSFLQLYGSLLSMDIFPNVIFKLVNRKDHKELLCFPVLSLLWPEQNDPKPVPLAILCECGIYWNQHEIQQISVCSPDLQTSEYNFGWRCHFLIIGLSILPAVCLHGNYTLKVMLRVWGHGFGLLGWFWTIEIELNLWSPHVDLETAWMNKS